MYIFQKTYTNIKMKSNELSIVLLMPSEPQQLMNRFAELVKSAIEELNNDETPAVWSLNILSKIPADRSPNNNYSAIYNADLLIAECTEKKPNVFYMLGIAHATGIPVCSCYRKRNKDDRTVDIPFNVHGRQSLAYSLADGEKQDFFKKELVKWIREHEKN